MATDFFSIYGRERIEQGALEQMLNVMSLEPVVAAALMPDAHQGYGMPIGGVAAVKDAVIPYAVGVDIGCRMHLTVLPEVDDSQLERLQSALREAIVGGTHFGGSPLQEQRALSFEAEAFLGSSKWRTVERVFGDLALKDRARAQFGTSGGGNHFVEWGVMDFSAGGDFKSKKCLALLSHSGSRSLGFTIANHYSKLASTLNPLPPPRHELSWLSMHTQEGQDYWELMNLAGDYSRINHEIIHREVLSRVPEFADKLTAVVSNHHNFAWQEYVDGHEGLLYVHRKGATPAAEGQQGIIPGSMATAGYWVVGKGNAQSINSASHGAGRAMSRSKALKTITLEARSDLLKAAGVDLISAGLDEAPQAYKDIEWVMGCQTELVSTKAAFLPKIVRMGGKVADEGD